MPGWANALIKCSRSSIAPAKPSTASLGTLFADCFEQVNLQLSPGTNGPAALKTLLGLIYDRFGRASTRGSFAKLYGFRSLLVYPFRSTCPLFALWIRAL